MMNEHETCTLCAMDVQQTTPGIWPRGYTTPPKPAPQPTPQPRNWQAAYDRRRARELAAPGYATTEQLAARWDYYDGRCWMCGKPAAQMDHVKPLAAGGSNWPSNQRPACWPCNFRKGARWPYSGA